MKVYIGVDSEGEACIVGHPRGDGGTGPWQFDDVRRRATEEAAAAVLGARDAGATDIVVHDLGFLRDRCPPGLVLLHDQLPSGIRIALGQAPLKRIAAAEKFDAAFLIGHHAMAGADGVMAHTYSMVSIERVTLNGRPVGEIGIEALQLGALGTPVVLVSADEAGVAEARDWLGNVETVATKVGLGKHGAISLHPADACALIRSKARAALQRLGDFKPFRPPPPYELNITCASEQAAEQRALRHSAERVGPRTVVQRCTDPLQVW